MIALEGYTSWNRSACPCEVWSMPLCLPPSPQPVPFFAIPLYPVPITLQDLFTTLSALLLGAYAGALSQVVYILIGLAGVPVFSGERRVQACCSDRQAVT